MGNQKDTFVMLFCSDDDCYKYLASLKWQEDKFVCKKCGNTTYHKGRSPYSRRCNKCKYDESVTAGTMFEKLKFPILIAFNIIYSMVTTSKGNKSVEFAKKFHIQQRTCWTFMKTVREAMGKMQPNQLKGDVGVGLFNLIDEKMVKGYRRWYLPEERILLAVEVKNKKARKAIIEVVNDENVESVKSFIDRHVHPDANIILETQKTRFKNKLSKEYKSIKFPYTWRPFDLYFEKMKDWLYEDIHGFSFKHLQLYANEYNYRNNSPKNRIKAFNAIIRVMVENREKK